MQCETCKYWDPDTGTANRGFCRRYAPRPSIEAPLKAAKVINTAWPSTAQNEWCGDWSAKVEIEE